MSDKIYTVDELRMRFLPVLIHYDVRRVILFGSYSKGNAKSGSDIDLLVDSGLKGLRFVGFVEDLRETVEKEMDVFDVTHVDEGTEIDTEIKRTGVVLYEK